jgi:hypothetical protein
MTDIDLDDLDPETLMLCQHCAKHPSLKGFIDRHGKAGIRCGICLNVSTAPDTCDPAERKALTYLIRSLVRFFYDEDCYNRHWGGEDSPAKLLQGDNPILESEAAPGFPRDREHSWLFLEEIFDNDVYPPYDEGVAVFAGHDDGIRMYNQALPYADRLLGEFRRRLQTENYFSVEPDLAALIEKVEDRIAVIEPPGQIYFRARLNVATRFNRSGDFRAETVYQPYQGKDLGAPPPQIARAGRANREGVSFLYLASDVETACAEIRPHPGHQLSVGLFRSLRSLRLANLEVDIAAFASSDTQLDLYAFVYAADQAMSVPVRPEAAGRYSITQLLADVLRQRGFDGVAFKSSLNDGGRNVCIFKPADFEYVEGSALVQRVKALRYELAPSVRVLEPEPGDWPLP